MRTIAIAVLAIAVGAGAAFAQSKALVLDDYEGALTGGATGTVDFGAGNGSSLQVTAASDVKHGGKQSLKAMFDAVAGGYMFIARGYGLDAKDSSWLVKNTDVQWKEYKAFTFWMYGTGSKTQLAVDLKDSGNEMWRFIVTDDTKGWKQIVCPLAEFYARNDWQPEAADKNGVMDFPIKSYQFEPLPVAKGVLYFDDVELSK